MCYWLVVSTPLRNISQLGVLSLTYGKIENMFQTTNQVTITIPKVTMDQTSPRFTCHRQLRSRCAVRLPRLGRLGAAELSPEVPRVDDSYGMNVACHGLHGDSTMISWGDWSKTPQSSDHNPNHSQAARHPTSHRSSSAPATPC